MISTHSCHSVVDASIHLPYSIGTITRTPSLSLPDVILQHCFSFVGASRPFLIHRSCESFGLKLNTAKSMRVKQHSG
jgi:hypothetical protein